MDNTLIRSERCAECGLEMLWTQNAWPVESHADAAYRCLNDHVADPATTKQCPACGVHDTQLLTEDGGRTHHRCYRCHTTFASPR
jgi:hypothetical protein